MKLFVKLSGIGILTVGMFGACEFASASVPKVYIAQTATGANSGADCADAFAYTFFNTATNWGSGAAQIGPGTVVHLCGTITTELQVNGSGTSGSVIEVLWESGAKISRPVGSAISLNSHSYLLFDGGVPCGPSTACSSTDAGTGLIENTANGSALANQSSAVAAFDSSNGSGNLEFRNLVIRNLYQHTSSTDTTSNIDTGTYAFLCTACTGTVSMHDSTLHDLGTGFRIETPNSATLQFFQISIYNDNWGLEDSGNGLRTVQIHDDHFGTAANWDTTSDAFHHNGLHLYMNTASDSIATYFYNNLSDGNWGSCCATDNGIYQEDAAPDNFYVFNNVVVQYAGNTAPAFVLSGAPVLFANNTMIGVATTPNNIEPVYIGGAGVSFENNAIQAYGQYVSVYTPGLMVTTWDHNQYGSLGLSGNAPWSYGSTLANTFAAWQAACSCDPHGVKATTLGVSSTGLQQTGSPLIGAGVNLTSLGIAALNSDTSAGGTRTPTARPMSGPWDVGAYQSASTGTLTPPGTITVSVQ